MSLRIEKYKFISHFFLLVFWLVSTVPFLVQETTQSYNVTVVNAVWGLAEASVLILGLWTLRNRVDIITVVIFVGLSFIDTVIINKLSILFWLNGTRLYYGFIFMFPIIRYFWEDPERRCYFVAKMDRLIYVYLVIQFPCMVYQCILYGAYDNVSGSIGWMASGVTSTLIYLSSFYLMMRRWNPELSYFENLKNNWVLLFLLIPTWLNETKISFIYIALYFFFLVPMDKQFIKRLVYIVPLIVIILSSAGWLYTKVTQSDNQMDLQDLNEYMFGNDILLDVVEYAFENDVTEVNEPDYSRGLKFYVTPLIFERHDAWLSGFGVGQYKGGSVFEKSEFAKRYFWLLRGTIIQLQMIMIETGVPGAILFIIFWITAFRLWRRHKGERNMRLSWMLGTVMILVNIYTSAFFIPSFYMQVMFMVFVCSRWHELPAYRHIPLLGTRKISFSWR